MITEYPPLYPRNSVAKGTEILKLQILNGISNLVAQTVNMQIESGNV